jgi:conjugative transfer signal peptidase TraF
MIRGLFADPRSHRYATAKRIAIVCVGSVVAIAQLCDSLGLRINTSPSLPVGLYVTTADPNASLVEFCPVEPYAQLAIVRGYRSAGNCRDGAAPLLKPVVAKAGDMVDVSQTGIAVNGKRIPNTAPVGTDTRGRQLLQWPSGSYLVKPGEVWVASSFNRRSFDSRYFGPIPTIAIRDRLRPLLTGGK